MGKNATKDEPKTLVSSHVSQRLRDGVLLLHYAVAAFLLIALLTYHNQDPGWSNLSTHTSILNAGGKLGAWLADFLLYMFGYLAYFFPPMLAYAAWFIFREARERLELDYYLIGLKVIGLVLIVIGGTGLANLYLADVHYHIPFEAGGIIGNLLGGALAKQLNVIGASVFLIAALLGGVTCYTGISWPNAGRQLSIGLTRLSWLGIKHLNPMPAIQWCRDRWQRFKTERATRAVLAPKPVKKLRKEKPSGIGIMTTAPAPHAPMPTPRKQLSRKNKKKNEFIKGLPELELLDLPPKSSVQIINKDELEARSQIVEQKLLDFGVEAKVVAVHPGPVITRYEIDLAPGIKVSRLTGLAKDLARSLSMVSVRIVEIIPGKSVVGLELPNDKRMLVTLREVVESKAYQETTAPLALGLGKDIAGYPVVVDLAKMPHLLVAGTTGSGKSVGVNAMLLSMLYKSTPEQVRFILVDPKMLELAVYDGIPHLLAPVVTDMKEAANALRWCVAEMERRYRLMASLGVRNLSGFNDKINKAKEKGEPILDPLMKDPSQQKPLEALPHIVVIIDEFADMMMVVGKKVEQLIARIAQKARAAGIHLILATQRPSVDVITGLIKANIPTRIAFQVSSKIDSRTIIDQQGAEQLLGHGDMLYLPSGSGVPVRVHGAFVADHEVHQVVNALKDMGDPDYLSEIVDGTAETEVPIPGFENGSGENGTGERDTFYDEAIAFVTKTRRASISSVQRRFKIGYNRAARIIEEMEASGVVTPMENNGSREVIAPPPPED